MIRFFLVSVLLISSLSSLEASDVAWLKIVTKDGKHVGYISRSMEMQSNGETLFTSKRYLKLSEKGSTSKAFTSVTQTYKNKDSKIIRIKRIVGFPNNKTEYVLEVLDDTAVVSKKNKVNRITKNIDIHEGVVFDSGMKLVGNWDFKKQPVLEFENLNLARMNLEKVQIQPLQEQANLEKKLILVRKVYSDEELKGSSTFEVDPISGRVLSQSLELFNNKIVYIPSTRNEASKNISALSVIKNSMIPAPYKLSKSALNGNIRYRFSFEGEFDFSFPVSNEQNTLTIDNFIVLDICEDCGVATGLTESERQEYLQPSLWIESDDKKIVRSVRSVALKDIDDRKKMLALGKIVRRKIKNIDFIGHYSASEAFRRGSGDCGEDAVLLAAMGRAANIPTRVASGLVYSRSDYHGQSNVFLPHTWTQAYIDGRWVSFDISLGGFDSSHILMSVGHGDPQSLSSSIQFFKRLVWEDMAHIVR